MTEQMQSEIAELSLKLDEIDDPRRCFALVQERIRKYRLQGIKIPDELARMERRLANECLSESQGR
jgi:hypothetical protein